MRIQQWQRPKTTKVYLHRPLSERIALLCPDFKILSLPLIDNGIHVGQHGVGMLFVRSDGLSGYDLDETCWRDVEYGLPIYEIENRDSILVRVEAFAGEERNPTVYFRVVLENDTDEMLSGSIGLMPRSGQEKYMLNQHQEGYSPYRPNYKNWFMLKRTWGRVDVLEAKSDMGWLKLSGCLPDVEWVEDSVNGHSFAPADYFKVPYCLNAGEKVEFYGALRANEAIEDFNYYEKRADAVDFWQSISEKIKTLPDTTDEYYLDIYRHSVMQCTQMIAQYEDAEAVSVRQGDIGRFVWPYEGAQVLINLERAGICEYSRDAYMGYFDRWLVRDGEDRGKIGSHAGWDNFTGSVLWGLSEHLIKSGDHEEFERFLPYLIEMRDYIERKRSSPREEGFERIFPSGTGSDWSERGQFWTFTDSHNCMALRSLCDCLEYFGSDEYEETIEMCRDYSSVICFIRDLLYRGHEEEECFILPHMLGIEFEDSEYYSYYTDGAPYLLYTGFIEPGSRMMEQMESFFRKRGQFERGLTGRMTSCASMWDEAYFGGYGDVWYAIQSETYWIKAWVENGEYEKAKESLDACLRYGMTEEGIVAERYCSINPWYVPWQPNGSGSSRIIEIMLEYFGERINHTDLQEE